MRFDRLICGAVQLRSKSSIWAVIVVVSSRAECPLLHSYRLSSLLHLHESLCACPYSIAVTLTCVSAPVLRLNLKPSLSRYACHVYPWHATRV